MRTVVEELSREFFAPFMLKLAAKKQRRNVAKKIGEGGSNLFGAPRKIVLRGYDGKVDRAEVEPVPGRIRQRLPRRPGHDEPCANGGDTHKLAQACETKKCTKSADPDDRKAIERPRRLHVNQERKRIELTQTSSVKWLKSACPLLPS